MARAPQVQDIEATPESDRLEGYPHPRHTRALFGHESAQHMLADAIADGRLHHGWLIVGPEGIGKATLAYAFARCVLASSSDRTAASGRLAVPATSIAYRQVSALSHPGLLVLRRPWDAKSKRFTTTIPVDEVRRLRMFLGHKSGVDDWRVILVDTADDLNPAAANAILKSLEEPPPRTVFVLLSSEPGRLLPTIRSRCRLLALSPLTPTDLKAAVTQAIADGEETKVPAPGEWSALLDLSAGSVRRALGINSSGGVKIHDRVRKVFSMLPAVDWTEAHALSDELGGAAAELKFEQFFEFLLDALGRLVRAQATGQGADGDLALAKRLGQASGADYFATAWSSIADAKAEAMALNLDRKALILEVLVRLSVAAKSVARPI